MILSKLKGTRSLFVILVVCLSLAAFLWHFTSKPDFPVENGDNQVVLAALGDSGTGTEAQYKVASSLKKICDDRNCNGVFLLGDVIYDKGVSSVDDPQFNTKFEIPYKEIESPFYIVLGNHDRLGCVECYIGYDSESPKWEFPGYFYKQSFGGLVDVFVLDTENFSQDQIDWLEQEVNESTSFWRIAAGHHPIYTNSGQYAEAYPEKKELLKASICNNFDLYLAGHSHGLESLGQECGVEYLVSGGGGADLYEILPNQSPFSAKSHGFLLIEATTNTLTYSFFNQEGKLLYSHQIQR